MLTMLAAAVASPVQATWDLEPGTRHRWLTETEVRFPGHVWLYADRNQDVRAHTLGLQLVVDCEVTGRSGDVGDLGCTITDAAVTGSAFPGHIDRLQPVLEELQTKLAGSSLELQVTERGHVRAMELDAQQLVGFENRRTRTNDAFLRMMVVRALAPLDLELPRDGVPLDERFKAHSKLAVTTPVTSGSAGKVRFEHQAEAVDGTLVRITSKGHGVLVPGGYFDEGGLSLAADLKGQTAFDTQNGRVREAMWYTTGVPTATSGPLARPYVSMSYLRALEPDETLTLVATHAWEQPNG